MTWKKKLGLCCILLLTGCSYNPLINNRGTGSAAGTLTGVGIGAGTAWLLGGSKTWIAAAGVTGGLIGYYVTTLRYASGGIIQSGGEVYQVGRFIGIYIPSDQLFEPNTTEWKPQARPILESALAVLKRYPDNNILISGNTSGFYRSRWEQKLSERRAGLVAAYLWDEGINQFKSRSIDMRRLRYVGYGDYFPISQDYTNEGIRTNSRIQITSYPDNCELDLDGRHVTMRNVGSYKD